MTSSICKLSRAMLSRSRSFSPLPLVMTSTRSKLAAPLGNRSHSQSEMTLPFQTIYKQSHIFQQAEEQHCPMPRILIVSRRHLRKGKFVDFVGEYHIDLVQENGGVPILLPRTMKTREQLEAYLLGGVDGVLVMEGNDLGTSYHPYGENDEVAISPDVLNQVAAKHTGDVEIDDAKDSIEMSLITDKVIKEGVPFLGLCRGSQLLNVAMGGTLYCDITAETGSTIDHIDYDNYDGHRHPISVLPETPLSGWFREEYLAQRDSGTFQLDVNSYHHQGIKTLAPGLKPMCFSPDGLIEGYFQPTHFEPNSGKYHIGLQWHPERMLGDYAGCRRVYEDFITAATAHRAITHRHMPITMPSSWGKAKAEQTQQRHM